MLEIHKYRIYERSRLRAQGMTDDEIEKVLHLPFKPAFINGKRRERESDGENQMPTGQFAFRRSR
ncbi:hypothetical protein [Prosthecobacter sp.]|uniref:hypothetical protein n=1 Tax=Prosthecobacter sp. TaxID=1965333 RepID=UPI003783ED28